MIQVSLIAASTFLELDKDAKLSLAAGAENCTGGKGTGRGKDASVGGTDVADGEGDIGQGIAHP